MRKLLSGISLVVSLVIGIALIYYVFNAYFIISFSTQGKMVDGLGRTLYESPWLVNFILRTGDWPGLTWFLIDLIVFWSSIFVLYLLIKVRFRLNEDA